MKKSNRNWLALTVLGIAGLGTAAAVAHKKNTESQTALLEEGDGAVPSDAITYEGELFDQYDQADITRSAYSQLSDRVSWRDLSA